MAKTVRIRETNGRFLPGSLKSGTYIAVNDNLPGKVEKAARKRVDAAAEAVRLRILEGMEEPHNGRTYTIPGTSLTYVASAPGEYPAIRMGVLYADVHVAKPSPGIAMIGSQVPYAKYLEGTGGRPGIRPFLSKAYRETLPLTRRILSEGWGKDLA